MGIVDVADIADEAFSSLGVLTRATEAAGQARRAQWALLLEAMKSNVELLRAWMGITLEAATAVRIVVEEECNRLKLDMIHAGCLNVARMASELREVAEEGEKALEAQISRADAFAQFSDPR